CGSLVALLEKATGRRAYSVGKPSPFMMRAARKRLGLRTAQTVMVGDTMETDIRGAVELGFQSALVLTGSTRREDLARYPYRPTLVVDSIADLDLALLAAGLPPERNSRGPLPPGVPRAGSGVAARPGSRAA